MMTGLFSILTFAAGLVFTPTMPESNLLPYPGVKKFWKHSGEGKLEAKGLPGYVGLLKLTGGKATATCRYQNMPNDRRYLPEGILDREFTVSMELRGSGKVCVEIEHITPKNTPAVWRDKKVVTPWYTAGAKWQTVKFKSMQNNPWCQGFRVSFKMEKPGNVEIRRPALNFSNAVEKKAVLKPEYAFVPRGTPAIFKIMAPGEKTVRFYRNSFGNSMVREFKTSSDSFTVPPSNQIRSRRIGVTVPGKGQTAISYVTELPGEKFDMLEKKAAKVKLPRKMNILFLGDSLTDYYRGFNYIDMVCFFVNRSNPGMITADNRGIGGDNCRYMIRRLTSVEKDEKAFPHSNNRARYFNMFNRKYDRIYIFIGANDSKVFSADNWSTPFVTLPDQVKNIREILKLLQRKFPGVPIVMIGAPNYHWELARKNALNRVKRYPKGNVVMFCQVKDVKNFNKNAQKAAAECKVKFIDTFEASTASRERKAMYEGDGVHLAQPGEIFFAGVVLDDLAQSYKK